MLIKACLLFMMLFQQYNAISFKPTFKLNRNDSRLNTKLKQLSTQTTIESQPKTLIVIAKEESDEDTLTLWELCLCGAFASAFGDFVMHPIDTIKVFQQTANPSIGLITAAMSIFKTNGFKGFYPGVVPYVIADGISGAIKFATFEFTKRISESKFPKKYQSMSQFICAALAMLASSITLVPGEVIKIRLQASAVSTIFYTFNE